MCRSTILERTVPSLLAGVVAFGSLLVTSTARGQGFRAPLGIAVNRGRYQPAAIDDAVAHGLAEWAVRDINRDVARHVRVEVFENSKESTRAQTTVFALCETTFQLVLNAGKQLSRVEVEFLILDAFGKPIGARAHRLVVTEVYRGGRHVWTESASQGRDVKAFYRPLPDWARRKLWLASGFLDKNPGQPPVPFVKTVEEDLMGVLGTVLELAPGVAKTILGQVAENLFKSVGGSSLKKAVADDRLRWGGADDVTSEKAKAHAETYINAGKQLWKSIDP